MRRQAAALALAVTAGAVLAAGLSAARLGYPPEEFIGRRQALAKAVGSGTVVLFGRTEAQAGIRFRQDNDFYYFTGNEDLNAAMVLEAPSGSATLYLPRQTASEIRAHGKNWLTDAGLGKPWGFAAIRPLDDLPLAVARVAGSADSRLWLRLAAGDEADVNRSEHATSLARRLVNLGGTALSEDASRAAYIRSHFPALQVADVTPFIDRMRTIKSAREIAVLRENGRISAEAIRRAILATRRNGFEYEIEAEATYWLLRNGVQGNAFPAIVGSGPNVNVWHYFTNGRQYEDGDLIVMDYGGALDYLAVDITRTWPVSGTFTPDQLKAYECALAAQKAIIAAMTVGATRAETRAIGEAVYKQHGVPGGASAGHYVGMSTHDVGDASLPFRAGMVLAVEPIVEDASKQIHVRIEDTVLITEQGPEILTSGVPKEIDDVLALVRQARAAGR
ncbi:MAG TPA: Xaa-Pro peptidase family protein [Vicinamibacterales bacterium]|nr:Xaa-Pro peptidase family protein [Vicinamibacterales bacterium]HOQ59699.1 Xaa-Pro peptidase family protein [Vicinamibacterales bacterium]HPK70442.1 Xaa-Pro peptidase family protein [Vicinamibacterales bacterium]